MRIRELASSSPTKTSTSRSILFFFIFSLQVYQFVVQSDPISPTNSSQEQQQQHDVREQSPTEFSPSSSSSSPAPSKLPVIINYECPANCECTYNSVTKRLDVIYGQGDGGSNIAITKGIRQLFFKRVTLKRSTLPSVLPQIGKDVLKIVEVQDALLDPTPFFKSDIFHHSQDSLQRVEIRNAVFSSNEAPSSSGHYYDSAFPYLTRLRALDSLIICDSSPPLANLVLRSLPPSVNHIILTNSSVSELYPEHFGQLRFLQSLNLSSNEIRSIPATLTSNLGQLTVLDLSRNRIEHLQEEVFHGLDRLKKLDLSQNRIRYVDTEVFNPLKEIQEVDLSFNNVIQFFEPYFQRNPNLRILNMKRTWTAKTFTDSETGPRSRMEMERLINTLQSIESLDLSDNDMLIIPETLTHMSLDRVYLGGNRWRCSCDDRWFLYWLETTRVSLEPNSPLLCHNGTDEVPLNQYLGNLNCKNSNIYSKIPSKYYTHMGLSPLLSCHRQEGTWPIISWLTPQKRTLGYVRSSSSYSASASSWSSLNDERNRLRVLENGTLLVSNFTKTDFGLYICVAQYKDLNITHYVHVGVDTSIFSDVRLMSVVWGCAVSFAFVLLVITANIIKALLKKCGVECSTMGKKYQHRRLRKFFDTMEHQKTTQLDWLRDNYNMQAKRIKDNCFSQMERIRESYSVQHKNLTDIRDYGTTQLHQLRDQYYDQIRRVSGYSAHQLCKVRENYLFQRNRVCKFSSHQLLRLRESYKWQAQTLNKILENLPTLNLDTCRGVSTCGRTDSIYLEDISEFQSVDEDSSYGPGILDICPRDRLQIEKLEHLSLLIPSEFLIPPCLAEPNECKAEACKAEASKAETCKVEACKTEAIVERHCEPGDDTDLDSDNANC